MSKAAKFSVNNRSELKVRLATKSDADVLARLRFEFRESISEAPEINGENKNDFVHRCAEWMRKRLSKSSNWICFVAEQESEIVAHIWLEKFEKIPNPVVEPELHIYLTNFYVVEKRRGRGIGAKLLTAALERCAAEKADSVILRATSESRSLYLRNGFAVNQALLEYKIDSKIE